MITPAAFATRAPIHSSYANETPTLTSTATPAISRARQGTGIKSRTSVTGCGGPKSTQVLNPESSTMLPINSPIFAFKAMSGSSGYLRLTRESPLTVCEHPLSIWRSNGKYCGHKDILERRHQEQDCIFVVVGLEFPLRRRLRGVRGRVPKINFERSGDVLYGLGSPGLTPDPQECPRLDCTRNYDLAYNT